MLTDQQHKAAWLKAHGRTDTAIFEAVGCHKATYYRWLKKEEFLNAVREIEEKLIADNPVSAEEAAQDLANARNNDREILAIQKELVNELSGFSLEVIKHMRNEGAENFSARSFPQLLKALLDTTTALQATTDRLVGIEALIDDIEAIEEKIQQKTSEFAEGEGFEEEGGGIAA